MNTFKKEWQDAIDEMRQEGFAVIVWTPDELGDTSPDFVEERSIELASDYLIGNE